MERDAPEPDSTEQADWERMHRHLLDDLEPDEFHRLERDLLASRETRARFLRVVRADVALHDEATRETDEAPATPRRLRWLPAAAIAAALAVGSVALWQTFGRARSGPAAVAQVPAAKVFATLVDTRDCRWKTPGGMTVDRRLAAGVIELEAGVAIVEFDGGARLALTGPAALELLGPKSARLHRGKATVRCEEGLYSFSLLTPTSTIIDLGTEFGVAVEADGTAEVHVLDGEVEVADAIGKEHQGTMFLNAGETVLLSANGENQRLGASTKDWVRDYSTPADRESLAVPPRVFARDVFPVDLGVEKRFSLGSGWKGAWWQATKGGGGDLRFVPQGPLVKRDGKAGMAMLVGGWVEVRRSLAEPIDPGVAGTCYVGFSLHRMNPTQRDKNGKLSEGMVLFRSSKDPTSMFGLALSGRNHWVVTEPGGWERSELPAAGAGPYFVVAKVEFDPRRGNRVSMAGFPDIAGVPPQEPSEWEFVTRRQLAKTTVPFDVIALQARQSSFKFGEITLGNSWQAVVNPPPDAR
jgi:ferric-dicitrate binding protein FerR (iron transport regulator)